MGTHDLCFGAKIRKISHIFMKIIVFTAVKNGNIIHRRVLLMKKNVQEISETTHSDQQQR